MQKNILFLKNPRNFILKSKKWKRKMILVYNINLI